MIFAVPLSQAVIDVTAGGEPRPFFLTLFTRSPSERNLRDFEDKLEQSSYYEQKVRPLFQLGRYHLLRELGEKALAGNQPGWYFFTPGMRYLVEPFYRDLVEPPKDDPVAVIQDLARQLGTRGIELLVMPVPGKASVHPERLVRGVAPGPGLDANTRRVLGELRRRGVAVIDLYRVLLEARAREPKRALYMKGDTHWTGEGARIAARAVADWIEQRPWYSVLSREKRYLRKTVRISRRGDVPRMTQIPHQERLFSAETVTCHRVLFAAGEQKGEPYEEPESVAGALVLVLGDSFSRVFETDEPGAAGWISNLAFELQQPVASIVNDGGASTLVRQQLAQDLGALAGKKLVVWSFVERDLRFGLQGWQPIALWPKQPGKK